MAPEKVSARSIRTCRRNSQLPTSILEAMPQVSHSDHHCAFRVERKVSKPPPRIEFPNAIVQRMRNQPYTADNFSSWQSRSECKQQQCCRVALVLIDPPLVGREAAQAHLKKTRPPESGLESGGGNAQGGHAATNRRVLDLR